MRLRLAVAASVAAVSLTACATQESAPDTDGTWVGTITTEGNVTIVVNESGSVWGGTATLVEEMSIGVEAGAEEYMFGLVGYIHVAPERIYVVDVQPIVRMYDHAGAFLGNIGRPGQGPGEYRYPGPLTTDATGRVFIFDISLARVNVYSASGTVLSSWPLPNFSCCASMMYPLGIDAIWAPVQEVPAGDWDDRRYGAQVVGPSGPYGEVTWVPEIPYDSATFEITEGYELEAPFSAHLHWTPAPGRKIVAGASDQYRFEVHGPEGAELVVKRYWEPTPVPAEHKEWERRRAVAGLLQNGLDLVLDGSEIPDHKPAYVALIPTMSGETWVIRQGDSERLTDCAEDPIEAGQRAAYARPCWADRWIYDVFGDDGRYLGEVKVPPGFHRGGPGLFVDGPLVVSVDVDSEGTIMVKRYRLVLPGEQ